MRWLYCGIAVLTDMVAQHWAAESGGETVLNAAANTAVCVVNSTALKYLQQISTCTDQRFQIWCFIWKVLSSLHSLLT